MLSAYLCGCECWRTIDEVADSLLLEERKMLKSILKVKSNTPNDVIYTELNDVIYTEPNDVIYTEPNDVIYTEPNDVIYTEPNDVIYTEPNDVIYTELNRCDIYRTN